MEKNGSRTGYCFEPHNTVCSRIWATPVESLGTVLKATPKVFFSVTVADVDVFGTRARMLQFIENR